MKERKLPKTPKVIVDRLRAWCGEEGASENDIFVEEPKIQETEISDEEWWKLYWPYDQIHLGS